MCWGPRVGSKLLGRSCLDLFIGDATHNIDIIRKTKRRIIMQSLAFGPKRLDLVIQKHKMTKCWNHLLYGAKLFDPEHHNLSFVPVKVGFDWSNNLMNSLFSWHKWLASNWLKLLQEVYSSARVMLCEEPCQYPYGRRWLSWHDIEVMWNFFVIVIHNVQGQKCYKNGGTVATCHLY